VKNLFYISVTAIIVSFC